MNTSSLASTRNSPPLTIDSAELCHHSLIHPSFKKMSGCQCRSRGPPVAAPSRRAALRRNDQQSASLGSCSLHGLNGRIGTVHHHRDESIHTRRFNLDPNLAGRSTNTILTAGLDGPPMTLNSINSVSSSKCTPFSTHINPRPIRIPSPPLR